ncbi:amidohydrolase [Priestia megaterium]|nr:amidohydrolase [Priestia megaterium]
MGTLFYGGKIYTMVREREYVESVYIEDGWIKDIGSEREIRKLWGKSIRKEVNLHNGVMYPGFVDSHLHLIGHGEKLIRLDLSQASSAEEVLMLVKEKVQTTPVGDWVIGEGWNENQWEDPTLIHHQQLDDITTEHPVILKRVCRHGLIANQKALMIAGITKDSPQPDGGIIQVDDYGMPTGFLADQAQDLVTKHIPPVSEAYLKQALKVAIEDCTKHGLTGAHTEDLNYYGGFLRTYKTFEQIVEKQKKRFRCHLLVHHEVIDEMNKFIRAKSQSSSFLEFGAMKIFADGSLGSQSALLSFPYKSDPSTNGLPIHSLMELKQLVKKARTLNRTVAIHAIGDLALEYVVDSIEQYPPADGQRDRIIHAQILRADLIERIKKLPAVLDIQPRFLASDFPWVIDRIGEENLDYCYAWKTLLKEGVMCAGGSDAPIEPVDPLLGIHAAVSRKTASAAETQYIANEKLTVFEAIQLFTLGSAQAVKQEHIKGVIQKNYIADFTVFEKDLFKVNVDDIPSIDVLFTVIDGEIVYTKSSQTSKQRS